MAAVLVAVGVAMIIFGLVGHDSIIAVRGAIELVIAGGSSCAW
jgi:hypothetical protein